MLVIAAETATMPSAQYQSLPRGMCSCSNALHRKTLLCGGIVKTFYHSVHAWNRQAWYNALKGGVAELVYRTCLENKSVARHRGFESHPLRQLGNEAVGSPATR